VLVNAPHDVGVFIALPMGSIVEAGGVAVEMTSVAFTPLTVKLSTVSRMPSLSSSMSLALATPSASVSRANVTVAVDVPPLPSEMV